MASNNTTNDMIDNITGQLNTLSCLDKPKIEDLEDLLNKPTPSTTTHRPTKLHPHPAKSSKPATNEITKPKRKPTSSKLLQNTYKLPQIDLPDVLSLPFRLAEMFKLSAAELSKIPSDPEERLAALIRANMPTSDGVFVPKFGATIYGIDAPPKQCDMRPGRYCECHGTVHGQEMVGYQMPYVEEVVEDEKCEAGELGMEVGRDGMDEEL